MRVAAIAITPPTYFASGGVSAAVQLMKRVAECVPTDMLVMAEQDSRDREGALAIHRVAARNISGRFGRLLPRSIHTLLWRADFGAWLDRTKPDIVHIHNPHPPGAMEKAAEACRKRGIPYVISTHGYVEFDDFAAAFGGKAWQAPIIDRLIRQPLVRTTRGAARMLMLSPEEKPILDRMGVPAERLDVVTNGIDPWFLEPMAAEEVERHLGRFHLPSDKPVIVFMGNHTRNKGIDVLLQAAMRMKRDALVVIGGGIRSAAEHQALLDEVGYDKSTGRAFFTDFVSRDEVKALYQRCDIFAFPSRADTLPLVILEAMASGKPVVATRIGGIPYEVVPETGVIIAPGDADALARELDRLVGNPELRRSMGQAGRARVRDLFNWERSAARAIAAYHSVLGTRSSAPIES